MILGGVTQNPVTFDANGFEPLFFSLDNAAGFNGRLEEIEKFLAILDEVFLVVGGTQGYGDDIFIIVHLVGDDYSPKRIRRG